MEKYRVNKVIGEGSFGKAILCARISDGKVRRGKTVVPRVLSVLLPIQKRHMFTRQRHVFDIYKYCTDSEVRHKTCAA